MKVINNKKTALVVQGGSLRSIFTAGVMDAFLTNKFNPFDFLIGVSGGAMCCSYYISEQFKTPRNILFDISDDSNFISFTRIFKEEGYVNLDYLEKFTQTTYPLDVIKGLSNLKNKTFEIVVTNLADGKAVYLQPDKSHWIKYLMASGALPFFTKGKVGIKGMSLMDGGWSNPIPIQRAIDQGAKKIVVIRTMPKDYKAEWTFFGKISGYFHKENPALAKQFAEDYVYYNKSVDLMNNPPKGIEITQIAPDDFLKTGMYFTSPEKLQIDYMTGIEKASDFLYAFGENYR